MTQNNKPARKMKSVVIARILAATPPLERIKNKNRVVLACQIDDLIKEKGFSYSQFAQKMGKKPSEISKWTGGMHNFTMDTLEEIAYHLDTSVAHLISRPMEEVQPIKKILFQQYKHVKVENSRNKYPKHSSNDICTLE